MADESQTIRGINWRETFPFTHLFRAFRIAVQPSKLMLGLIALLALYAGGRILDGIWPARHLAVPGEVSQYEQNVAAGGSSEQFEHDRWQQREQIETRYAQRLLEEKIVTDDNSARAAAVHGKYLGDKVRGYILNRREERVRLAAQAREEIAALRSRSA